MSDFLLEIGLEEIPAHLVTSSANQLKEKMISFLNEQQLSFGSIEQLSTPRRLSVIVKNISAKSQDVDEEVKGPSLKIAKDETGTWSKAAQGFAKSNGIHPDDFIVKELDGVEYIFAQKHQAGKSAADILLLVGDEIIKKLNFSTYMKWGNYSLNFVRPIQWLLAILDNQVIDFNITDIQTSNKTFGHRFLSNQEIDINTPDEYLSKLQENFVIVESDKRKSEIKKQIQELADQNNWQIDIDEDLLEEVNNLVEYPTVFAGEFDEKYLDIPDIVLITSMREHQRFFYVADKNGKLLNKFISVRNGNDQHIDNVIVGNQRVLAARLADAQFFYDDDRKKTINGYMEKVGNLSFHDKIGSMQAHMRRTGLLAQIIAKYIQNADTKALTRAAEIYKYDLATGLVGEFDELQGKLGSIYAKDFGEDKLVAQSIEEHYMPTSANGDLPKSAEGAILAVADKLDSLLSFFGADLIPSGANDPYSLRRAATGIVRIIQNKSWRISLKKIIDEYLEQLRNNDVELDTSFIDNIQTHQSDVVEFIVDRIRQLTNVSRKDIVLAATSKIINLDVNYVIDRIAVLNNHANDADFKSVIENLTRVDRLVSANPSTQIEVNPSLFENDAEQNLYTATKDLNLAQLEESGAETVYKALSEITPLIFQYFEDTMILVDDVNIRNNRLAQLKLIDKLTLGLGDLSAIVIK